MNPYYLLQFKICIDIHTHRFCTRTHTRARARQTEIENIKRFKNISNFQNFL